MSLSSNRTLILNSTFQPLSVVSFKRAISLMHNNKINVIKNSEIILRSEKEEFFIPYKKEFFNTILLKTLISAYY